MLNRLASEILVVPFNKDYTVSEDIRKQLTEDEFFTNCYVDTDFDDQIERIKNSVRVEIDESDDSTVSWEMVVSEELDRIDSFKISENTFRRWIDDGGNAIYCIMGDAGTGKTTYLHNLEYRGRNKRIVWEIVDIQEAHTPLQILSQTIWINHFDFLEYKVISALLSNIFKKLCFAGIEGRLNYKDVAKNLESIYTKYRLNCQTDFPSDEVIKFFDDSPVFELKAESMSKEVLSNYARDLCKYITTLLITETSEQVIYRLWNIYMTLLRSIDCNKKYIIAFDNIERFVGDDEICNTQIDEFVEKLRHLLDSCSAYDNLFFQKFQMILLMRNTSSRMSRLPLQRIDFWGHELNVNGWFPIDKIVENKLQWYCDKKINVSGADFISQILGSRSFDGCGPRSLQSKLNMLFNNNNRVTLDFLANSIDYVKEYNLNVLMKFDEFRKNDMHMPSQLARFAARSIIMRIVMDSLRKDKFFKNIVVQSLDNGNLQREDNVVVQPVEVSNLTLNGDNDMQNENKARLGYARRVLSILYEYSLLHQNQNYMPFDNLVQKLCGNGYHHVDEYFDNNNITQRNTVSQILFHMNYYDNRKDNWLHFIDIQYNVQNARRGIRISSPTELMNLIDIHHSEIAIKIKTAGIAYLNYIVHSFEFFSCRIMSKNTPPLLCLIPSLDDLKKCKSIENLGCIKTIEAVKTDAICCINIMNARNENANYLEIPYKRSLNSNTVYHERRIINSHVGYINNFRDCVRAYYEKETEMTQGDRQKLNDLYSRLDKIMQEYNNIQLYR